jgi:arylsulfatase
MPTILDLVGIEVPGEIERVAQSHVDGVSQAPLFVAGGATAPARRDTQHFEMLGSRAIYHQGWKAVTFHPVGPLYDDGLEINAPFDDDVWELYHVAEDASECHDLAAEHPDRVAAMVELWWEEARRNDVLPLDNRVWWTLVHPKPDHRAPRDRFRYFQGGAPVPEPVAVNVRNRSHRLVVDVDVPDGEPATGVLLALGSALGGWSLHLLAGRPRYVHNLYGKEHHVVAAPDVLAPGAHRVEYAFTKDEGLGGTGVLRVDGAVVADGPIARFTPSGFNGVGVGLTCGYEWGPAVGEGYSAPFPFSGTITRAEVETTGPVVRDPMAEIAAILAEQ